MQNISLENKAQQGDVENAFKDLEALMIRAGDMVKLVQTLNSKLTQQQNQRSPPNGPGGPGQEDDETQTFIRSSLVQLGLPAPAITPDMVADERKYLEGLANELGGLLTGKTGGREDDGLMVGRQGKGLVGMDQVWGLWNRARGVCEWLILGGCRCWASAKLTEGRPRQLWSHPRTFRRLSPCYRNTPARGSK